MKQCQNCFRAPSPYGHGLVVLSNLAAVGPQSPLRTAMAVGGRSASIRSPRVGLGFLSWLYPLTRKGMSVRAGWFLE